ncbi:Hypothetical protein, putative [Bodo saltans]|uniref:Uncharacterized protein n=1 Tax=Bodo saltans TaxID=75058 RepID=A0A0S4JA49_BODSA|nr:Hypothetical protein, putative [Bodo saltans]|eukprot:CUG88431.1 Hypothetical protein, putative [Bodo saltans]
MLIKLLVGMAHMVQQYPTSRFFVRGADDAYVSFRQVYVDVLKLVSEEEKRVASSRRKYFGGHVITTAINNVCGNFEVSKSGVLYRSGGVSRDRALAPVMSPAYVSGGGSTMNAELVRQLVHSLQDVPPTLWLEEDTMIGRLTAPMVRPTKDFRFHNFFNATQRVDTAFQGQVPRAYIYCHQNSWVVHKYPAPSALSFVDAKTLFMYCTRHDFMSARATAHHCAATLDARFVRSQQVSQKGDRDEGVDDTAKEANMFTTNTTDVTSSSAGSHHVSTRVRWPTWKLGPPAYYAPYHHHSARIGGGLRGGGGGLVNRQMKRGQPCKPKNIGMLIAHAPRDCHQNLDEA